MLKFKKLVRGAAVIGVLLALFGLYSVPAVATALRTVTALVATITTATITTLTATTATITTGTITTLGSTTLTSATVAATGAITSASGGVAASSSSSANWPIKLKGAYSSTQLATLSASPGEVVMNTTLGQLCPSSATVASGALGGAWVMPSTTTTPTLKAACY